MPEPIIINLPKNTAWDRNKPILLRGLKIKGLAEDAALVHPYNWQNIPMGLGLYSPEAPPQLIWLSAEMVTPALALAQILHRAWKLRAPFFTNTDACRLIHHSYDGLPGLIVDRYGPHFVVSSETAASDLLIEPLCETLVKEFAAQSIYGLHTGAGRQARGRLLSQGPLLGTPQEALIFEEDGFSFTYSPEASPQRYPLERRPLRRHLNRLLHAHPGGHNTLLFGPPAEHMISAQNQDALTKLQTLKTENRSLTDLCQDLRKLPAEAFTIAVFTQQPLKPLPKNRTALFHLYYQLVRTLAPDAALLIETTDWNFTRKTLQQIAQKTGRTLSLLSSHGPDPDHPATIEALTKQFVHLHVS